MRYENKKSHEKIKFSESIVEWRHAKSLLFVSGVLERNDGKIDFWHL